MLVSQIAPFAVHPLVMLLSQQGLLFLQLNSLCQNAVGPSVPHSQAGARRTTRLDAQMKAHKSRSLSIAVAVLALAGLACGAINPANASPITYDLKADLVGNGDTLAGTFTFDPTTLALSSASIELTGTDGPVTFDSFLGGSSKPN